VPDPHPARRPDLQEALTANRRARHIVAGFARATPALSGLWLQIESSLWHVPVLTSEITRLDSELQAVRLDRANLAAAARATLAASHDGDPDPLSYLCDELTTQAFLLERDATGNCRTGPPDPPHRPAAHDGDQLRRPAPRNRLAGDHALGLALPVRTRARLLGRRDLGRELVAARHPPALVGIHRRHRYCRRRDAGSIRRKDGPAHAR
jgi:hypothetical protein